jgi:hypothetical protein
LTNTSSSRLIFGYTSVRRISLCSVRVLWIFEYLKSSGLFSIFSSHLFSSELTERNKLHYKIVDVLPVQTSVDIFNLEESDILLVMLGCFRMYVMCFRIYVVCFRMSSVLVCMSSVFLCHFFRMNVMCFCMNEWMTLYFLHWYEDLQSKIKYQNKANIYITYMKLYMNEISKFMANSQS